MFVHQITLLYMVELYIFDFDVLLGMDWLYACFASIDCRARVVMFQLPCEPVLEWKGGITFQKSI